LSENESKTTKNHSKIVRKRKKLRTFSKMYIFTQFQFWL
jgi:hypothetical protein